MPHAHAVQIYRDLDELAAPVADYLADGFASGEPAIVIATAEHAPAIGEHLASRGWEIDALEREGLLTSADAERTLASFMVDATPSAARFEAVVGALVDDVAQRFPDRGIRAFGEMVNVLVERGRPAAAIELERLWNGLARTRRFSLLCGYRLDVFDRSVQTGLMPDVCRTHSHVAPASDPARLARAVDRALDEVLGPREAGRIYVVIGEEVRAGRVPAAQLVLMWLSEHMPALADRILASARRHYAFA